MNWYSRQIAAFQNVQTLGALAYLETLELESVKEYRDAILDETGPMSTTSFGWIPDMQVHKCCACEVDLVHIAVPGGKTIQGPYQVIELLLLD